MSSVWERSHYNSGISFLIGIPVREYDITKANISILRDNGLISEEEYQYYYDLPKKLREVAIGKLIGSDPSLSKALINGFKIARRIFMESNNLEDEDILRIATDSITVINKPVNNLFIGKKTQFRLDAEYTSYYKIGFIELFYLYNVVTHEENLIVKQLGEKGCTLHKEYMLDFLSELFYTAQIEGIQKAITLLSNVYKDYIGLNMDLGYYREFNSGSRFRLKEISQFKADYMEFVSERERPMLDISYNEELLRIFNMMYSSIYFRK